MKNKVVIDVKNVSKDFTIANKKNDTIFSKLFSKKPKADVIKALRNINFEVQKGECIGIIGPNGSGKTTLISIIAQILYPTKGNVKTKGKIANFFSLGLGFHPEFNAKENVYLYGSIMGLSKKEIDKRFDKIISFAELERFVKTKLKNFSRGMMIRLAFSTAIQVNPDILLIDEALGGGDMRFQKKCSGFFEDFIKKGKTIILVSHSLKSIQEYCNKTILLNNGKIVAFDKTDKVVKKYIKMVNDGLIKPIRRGQKPKVWRSENQKRFIITCAARTGSTMLRMMLNQHPEIICKGEVISPHKMNRKNGLKFFRENIFNKRRLSGFKFKYKQLLEQYPEIKEEIINGSDIKIIHLIRKNLIKRYVSNKIAVKANLNLLKNNSKIPGQVRIKINFKDMIDDIKKNEKEQEKIKRLFKHHKMFAVYYEDFYPKINKKALNELQRFLGVKPKILEPLTKKINSDNLKDIIENYNEIKENISKDKNYKKYAKYLN